MQSIFLLLDITKVGDFHHGNVSRTQVLCHVIHMLFEYSFGKAQPCQVSSLQDMLDRI